MNSKEIIKMTYADLLRHIVFKDYGKLEIEVLKDKLVFKLNAPTELIGSGENDLFAYKYAFNTQEQVYELPFDNLGETLADLLDDVASETTTQISFQISGKLNQLSETLKFGR